MQKISLFQLFKIAVYRFVVKGSAFCLLQHFLETRFPHSAADDLCTAFPGADVFHVDLTRKGKLRNTHSELLPVFTDLLGLSAKEKQIIIVQQIVDGNFKKAASRSILSNDGVSLCSNSSFA